MNRSYLFYGFLVLVLGIILYLQGGTFVEVATGINDIKLYPAGFLVVLGVVVMLRGFRR